MIKEKRKNVRRPLHYTAWIGVDDSAPPLRGCTVADISDTGAKLNVEDPNGLPDSFHLLLSGRGRIHRKCNIVWRTTNQIGVHFEKPPVERASPTRAMRAKA